MLLWLNYSVVDVDEFDQFMFRVVVVDEFVLGVTC